MGGFAVGMGGGGYNPTATDAYSALMSRIPGMIDASQARKTASAQSALQSEAQRRKLELDQTKIEKERRVVEQRRFDADTKRKETARQLAERRRREIIQARASTTKGLVDKYGGASSGGYDYGARAVDELYSGDPMFQGGLTEGGTGEDPYRRRMG